ncbi:RidA family protein [Photobacterium sp. DNB23_23_1]|uniref:RidA family protein n=1 Tax=Photobacterium pectinilyticum TaxID=2906793 RepID=A0ABT1N2D2_9GAMM|nr:RidA family protein [Photobacterium sp. ZSDE20]MCQ1058897.1 RidA family protein [Photobacterium sp. ZSDE20]MDD1823813.1 RidA family protein [Photobacterium sp. ZSDE20]
MSIKSFSSDIAPSPAGTYSMALEAGNFVFLAGQTPRDRDNIRHGDKPFAYQARLTLDNLEAAANAAGLSLKNAVKVSVFLRNVSDAKEFDSLYAQYVGTPPPARILTQSNLVGFDIEVDAILYRPADET